MRYLDPIAHQETRQDMTEEPKNAAAEAPPSNGKRTKVHRLQKILNLVLSLIGVATAIGAVPGALLILIYGAHMGIVPYVMANLNSSILISLSLVTLFYFGVSCLFIAYSLFWICALVHRVFPQPDAHIAEFSERDQLLLSGLSFSLFAVLLGTFLLADNRETPPLLIWFLIAAAVIDLAVFLAPAPPKIPAIGVVVMVLATTLMLYPGAGKQFVESSMRNFGYRSAPNQWVTIDEPAYRELQSRMELYGVTFETCSRTIGARRMYFLRNATAALYNLGPKAFLTTDLKPDPLFPVNADQLLVLPAVDGAAFCTLNNQVGRG